MLATLSLFRREFFAYFLSPIAYVVMVVVLGGTGYLFSLTLDQLTASGAQGIEFPMQILLGYDRYWYVFLVFWVIFLCIPPALTMRLFAEERSTGTLEMLMTTPLRDWQVVLSKFSACLAFYIVLWAPTLIYLPILLNLEGSPPVARIDPWPVVTSYLGLILAGSMFLALGLLVSSLVKSQIVAFLVSLCLSMTFIVVGVWRPEMDSTSPLYRLSFFFSVPLHFNRDFARGILDTRHIVLYASVALCCLFMTVRSLESRRWR